MFEQYNASVQLYHVTCIITQINNQMIFKTLTKSYWRKLRKDAI